MPGPEDKVAAEGRFNYDGSPLYDTILSDTISIGWRTEMRHIGW
jgi:hypothetical protein